MQLDKYKGVIKRVYERSAGQSFESFYAKLSESLEIAAEVMGDPSVSIETLPAATSTPVTYIDKMRAPVADPFKGALLISSAPPVAGADETGDAVEDDIDYYESKPGKGDGANRLQQKLQSLMPRSITVKLPGFDDPLTLNCGIGSPGLRFVHVNYTLIGSQELGPRVTVMTSQKDLDPDAILRDIVSQATAMYSKEKRVIVPHATAPQAPPSNQDLQNMLVRDRANQPSISSEDVEDARNWASNRSSNPRWQ